MQLLLPAPGAHSPLIPINDWIDANVMPYCGLLPRGGRPSAAAAGGQTLGPATGHGAAGAGLSDRLRDQLEGAVFGALVGDALALGSHYEYDSQKIWRAYGGSAIRNLDKPGSKNRTPGWKGGAGMNFHPTKGAGDLTDYGDNAIFLLETLAADEAGRWDAAAFARHWKRTHETYEGYRTMATRHTYQNLREGLSGVYAASDVDDMGGATRTVGLILSARNETEVLQQAKQACQLTHKHPLAVLAAQFVALSAWRVAWRDEEPRVAMEAAAGLIGDDTLNALFAIALRKLKEVNNPSSALSKQVRAKRLF